MTELERIWQAEWGPLLGLLVARFRDLDLAEESLAGAFEAAAEHWPVDGVPDNPAGWLHTVARRRALDRLRRHETAARALPLLVSDLREQEDPVQPGEVADDHLRLLLLCCHPALAPEAQAALALRLGLGVATAEVARLFLVSEPTMAARITRAKRKIARSAIPFALPDDLAPRVESVVRTAYLCFTAGYAPHDSEVLHRAELAGEAIRLLRVLRGLTGATPAVDAALALMVLQHSRRDARADERGRLVLLPDQDRGRWHDDEIATGLGLLQTLAPTTGFAEELRLQALIAAEHARSPDGSDWTAIVQHYDRLLALTRSPVVALNRAVAVAEADGPRAGLAALAGLELPGHRLPAVRGELLARAGATAEARVQFELALAGCGNAREAEHLRRRRDSVGEG